MGFGSRLLNLFSPKKDKGSSGGRWNDSNDEESPPSTARTAARAAAANASEGFSLEDELTDHGDNSSAASNNKGGKSSAANTAAAGGDVKPAVKSKNGRPKRNFTSSTNNNSTNNSSSNGKSTPPEKSAKSSAKKKLGSGKKSNKGECSHPGCTKALFARGRCYRHDQETIKLRGSNDYSDDGDSDVKKGESATKNGSAASQDAHAMEGKTKKKRRSGGGAKKSCLEELQSTTATATRTTTTPSTSKRKKGGGGTTPASTKSTTAESSTKKSKGECNQSGCDRALFARGMCYRHDQEMTKKNGTVSSSTSSSSSKKKKKSSSTSILLLASVSSPKKRKSSEMSTTTATTTPKTTSSTKKRKAKMSGSLTHCSYPGCKRALFARGKCYRHDTEAKRAAAEEGGGILSTTSSSSSRSKKKRKKATTPSSGKSSTLSSPPSSRKKKGHCNHPGCTRALFARGWCYRHDQERKNGSASAGSSGASSRRSKASNSGKKSSSSSSALSFRKGQRVEARYRGRGKQWYKGRIGQCFESNEYEIFYDDGDHDRRLSVEFIRPDTDLVSIKKSNSKSAVPILSSLTQALTSSSSKTQRKSAIARRPRQLKPTEKLLAMQEDALALNAATVGGGGGKKRATATTSAASNPPKKKKMRVSSGDVSIEELTADTPYNEEDDETTNYDNVVCCLCKCGVDFSDADFFLPEENVEKMGSDNATSSLDGDNNLEEEASRKTTGNLKKGDDDSTSSKDDDNDTSGDDEEDKDDEEDTPPFQLPRQFYNPRNGLILCDGPAHAGKRRGNSSNGVHQRYQCERAYHQRCHFIPVFAVPRGPWRCLICRYRDKEYLRKKGGKNNDDLMDDNTKSFSDEELNDMFRCNIPQSKDEMEVDNNKEGKDTVITNVPPAIMSLSKSDIASLEQEFEHITGPLKAKILQEDLTTKAEKIINAALSNIRNSEHSLRSFTETSRSRKVLAERIECIGGLPQELTQCVMRIAQNKLRIKDLVVVLEESIRCAPHHVNSKSEDASGCIDAVSELMQWYMSQSSPDEAAHFNPGEMEDGKTLLQHLFPEGDLHRRRFESRTGEARVEAEEASVKSDSSGVSLDDLKCACCHGGVATDENDMLLCDGVGCYRAFHMQCLEPKVTLEEVEAAGEDAPWFCPLCTAHANLVHYSQREYLQDDWEHDWDEIMRRRGHTEWETANDVFPEAELELRVAQKFKDGIKDDETTLFIAETFGIGTVGVVGMESESMNEDALAMHDDDDEEDDEDFDAQGGEDIDADSSADEDMKEEKKLLKEKIGKDELNALSDCSSSEESDSDDDDSADEDAGLRRSKRRRFTFPVAKGDDSSDNGQSSNSRPSDIGALDTSNIVRGKRNRTKVDYRKLADTMFGDDSDEEAKGSVMKYDYKPKKAPVDESSDEDDSSSESDGDDDGGGESQNNEIDT